MAFIIAALIVLLLGFRWFSDSDDASGTTNAQDWALDVPGESGSPTTTIGASPEAVAVRVGTAVPHGAEEDQSVTIGIPGTSIEIEIPLSPTTTTGPGGSGPGGTTPGGGPTTTRPRTTPTTRPGGGTTQPTTPTTDPPTTDPPTTDPPTTDPPTTDPPTTDPPTTEDTTIPPELTGLSIELPPIELPPVGDTLETAGGDLVGALVGTVSSLL
ncbi:MAG TPA: hypothetical protein VGO78_26660, partial [Acidimicrobiales bacterium]|nr:hypothetical protein [Acidimicrobiales bacterium]